MSLKLNLAPGEAILIGKARVENGDDRRCNLIISGDEKVLRQKRIMREAEATTPMKRLYYVVQSMYLADDRDSLNNLYHAVSREAVSAWPILTNSVTDVSEAILAGQLYEALHAAHKLVEAEAELVRALAQEIKP